MSQDKALVRLGILAFCVSFVFHFATRMKQEVWKTSNPQLPRR